VKTKASYEKVIAAIDRLKNNRQEPTLDAILSITGGSKGTVHKLWLRYKEEHNSSQVIEGGLSTVIQNAILAEIVTKTNDAKAQLETNLSKEKAISLSLANSNEKQEATINELQHKLSNLNDLLAKSQGRYEQADKELQTERKKTEQAQVALTELNLKLEILENHMNNIKKQNADYELQLTQYQTKSNHSEKQAAIASQQVVDLNKRLNEQIEYREQQTSTLLCAQETIEKQNMELKELERAKAQAEQMAVIAQVKLEHANNNKEISAQAH
jgi:chromosome segregation ATPase